MNSSDTLVLPAAPPRTAPPAAPVRPCPRAVLRRVGATLWVACVVPAALFYVTLVTVGITTALVTALAWTYGAIVWRWVTNRPMSGLLVLTVSVMTIRTVFTLTTGNTFIYFFQPVVSDGAVAVVFLVSLATARPAVARLATDFYPLDRHLAGRPRIRRLFWKLTLLWGAVGVVKSAVGFWLLTSLTLTHFALVKPLLMTSMTLFAIVVTVWASALVLRKESALAIA